MIVNYTDKGWEVITQRAHGVLAAQLAVHWKFVQQPDCWIETILAIAEHDDAELELDGESLLTETGGPRNYTMKKFDLAHCTKLFEMSLTKSRYIALLTSMHMDFLYKKESPKNSIARKFLKQQREYRNKWRTELGWELTEITKLYRLMEWCDACSLLLCQNQLPPEQRAIQISNWPGKKINELIQLDNDHITIDPWPFNAKSFPVSVECRVVTPLKFISSAAFRKAFMASPVNVHRWTFQQRKT